MFRFIGYGEKAGSDADIIAKDWENGIWTLEYDPVDGAITCIEYLSRVE